MCDAAFVSGSITISVENDTWDSMKTSVAFGLFALAFLHSLPVTGVEKGERSGARMFSDLVLLAFCTLWWSSLGPGTECLFCPNEEGHNSFAASLLSLLPNSDIPLA